jgi:hypothetical protein
MEWKFIIALIIAIPIVIFPAVFVWYTNIGGLYQAIKKARERRAGRVRKVGQVSKVESNAGAEHQSQHS